MEIQIRMSPYQWVDRISDTTNQKFFSNKKKYLKIQLRCVENFFSRFHRGILRYKYGNRRWLDLKLPPK